MQALTHFEIQHEMGEHVSDPGTRPCFDTKGAGIRPGRRGIIPSLRGKFRHAGKKPGKGTAPQKNLPGGIVQDEGHAAAMRLFLAPFPAGEVCGQPMSMGAADIL